MIKDTSTLGIVHQILAREAERSFALARQLGFKMPIDYDVGMKYRVERREREGERVRFTLRASDATVDVVVLVPYLDNRMNIARVDKLWTRALDDLGRGATQLAHAWIDKHPESAPADVASALDKMKRVAGDAYATMTLQAVAEYESRHAKYEER